MYSEIFLENSPLKNEVVQLLNFVELRGNLYLIENKILKFNDIQYLTFFQKQTNRNNKKITTLTDMDLT